MGFRVAESRGGMRSMPYRLSQQQCKYNTGT